MELKSGYKRTEVGAIPEDWTLKPISSIATTVASGRSSTDSTFGEFPVYGSTGIIGRSIKGDYAGRAILIARVGANAGKLSAVDGKYGVTDNTIILRIGDSVIWSYAWRQLEARRLNSLVFGSGQPLITGTQIKNVLIPLPASKAEQEAIAEVLSDTDAVILTLEQLIAKKRKVKQGAMRELLTGGRRLPPFCTEWESVNLGALFTFKNGLNKGKEFFGQGTPIVNYMDVFQHPAIRSSMLTGRVSLTSQELSTFDVRIGDVFFTRTSETVDEVGMASVVLDEPRQTVFSGFLLRARPKNDRLHNGFKQYCFAPNYVRKQITSRASYTTRALTNGKILSAVTLRVPKPEEQVAIAEILSDIDAGIAALELKLAKARQLKQGMMQELLTGRTRLI